MIVGLRWRRKSDWFVILLLATIAILPVLISSNPVLAAPPPKFTLEGLTLLPSIVMTSGDVKGWVEDQWIPFRLTIENKGDDVTLDTVSVQLDYRDDSKYGIDAFASCFSISSPYCGSGSTPTSGTKWKVLVNSVGETPDSISFVTVPGGRVVIQFQFNSVFIPGETTLEMKWAVHLALGGGSNLACSAGSPLLPCTPTGIPAGSGASSFPGSSLHVSSPEGNQDVPIKQAGAPGKGTIVVVKNTIGGDGTFGFTGTGTGGFPGAFSIATSGRTGSQTYVVDPGSYSVSETVPSGWELTGSSCSSGSPAGFTVSAGGSVTCTFTDTFLIPPPPPPPPVGGDLYSLDKSALVGPYLVLLGLVGAMASAFAMRRRRRT